MRVFGCHPTIWDGRARPPLHSLVAERLVAPSVMFPLARSATAIAPMVGNGLFGRDISVNRIAIESTVQEASYEMVQVIATAIVEATRSAS
jgi:hypothetical protein